jgi:hypothetical protein
MLVYAAMFIWMKKITFNVWMKGSKKVGWQWLLAVWGNLNLEYVGVYIAREVSDSHSTRWTSFSQAENG